MIEVRQRPGWLGLPQKCHIEGWIYVFGFPSEISFEIRLLLFDYVTSKEYRFWGYMDVVVVVVVVVANFNL